MPKEKYNDVETLGKPALASATSEHDSTRGWRSSTSVDTAKSLALLSISGLNTFLPTLFGAETWRASYTKFPVCTPTSIHLPAIIARSLEPISSCQLLGLTFAVSTAAYWICAFSLLRQPRWAALHTPKIAFGALCAMLVQLLLYRDVAAVILEVMPLYIDVGVVMCLVEDLRAGPQ